MADPEALTALQKRRAAAPGQEPAEEPAHEPAVSPSAETAPESRHAAPAPDPLELAVARARVEGALFGNAAPIKVGRYVLTERAGAGGMGVVWSAWDPELSRGVALKLASSGDAAVRARARDEGRALAKLSHPNVVPIYDVFEAEQGVFLVMELVKGKTLRALAAERPGAMVLVRAYRQAGEGLAAAHAAGLVHRDFKPDNAILGADGRVRVLDFGLAHAVAPDGATSEIAGTPRYMAPEQRAGAALTAAVDQYALCVSLREALAEAGAPPRWLEPILARGAAERPEDRYPSMPDLLRALALDPRARWRRRAAASGGVVALGAVLVAFTLGRAQQAPEDEPCGGGPALIEPSWGDARRAAVATRFGSLATPYAQASTPKLLGELDRYARRWVELHGASCRAHRRGEISPDLLDRRAGCLSRRRAALATVSEVAATTTDADLPQLVLAVGQLPDLGACEDDEALVTGVAPPPPGQATEAAALVDLLARVDVQRDAGRFEAAGRDAEAAVTRARALGYRPLVARALLARGRVALRRSTKDRGAEDFAAATREGIAVGDDPLAIEAFARRAFAVATTVGPEGATDGLPLVEALGDRLGDRARFARALLHMNLGSVALARGDRTAAREVLERARTEAAAITGAGAIELTGVQASLVALIDDPARRTQVGDELVEVRTRALGALHPRTLEARALAASLIDDPVRARTTLLAACRDLARYHPGLEADLTDCGYEVAWAAIVAGDRAMTREAALLATRAVASEPERTGAARALLDLVDGKHAAARDAFVALQRAPGESWWQRLYVADAAVLEAVARLALGDRAEARRALDRARSIYDAIADALPSPVRARRLAAITTLR